MKRALVLVEGQSEERFVKDVVQPWLVDKGIWLVPTIIATKRVKNGKDFKGGVSNFSQFENDVRRLLSGAGDALVTTMIDYYRLPSDFPGMDTRPQGSALARVTHVENEIRARFGAPARFHPYLALHEFEALLFSETAILAAALADRQIEPQLKAIRNAVPTPEDINERPGESPSARIIKLYPPYQKTFHGPVAASRMGIGRLCSECPHFSAWIDVLVAFGNA